MEYRKMEKLDVETSLLGFGCMRFPMKDGKIDEQEAEKMLDKAISNGVNYIDTAYPYHNGDSEPFVGRVLDKYDRKSYFLATKLPVWDVNTLADAERIFEEQLTRLNKDYIDFYLLHALDKARWDKLLKLGVIEYCENLKKEGKIRFLGFSFHASYNTFEEILKYREWDFCQIQYNYMDTQEQAGDLGYALTEKLNVPLVIMEPVKGGQLASLPDDINKIFLDTDSSLSTASWAIRWVASHPNIKTVLSGMSTMEQVEDNLKTFSIFKALNEKEAAAVKKVAETLKSRIKNGCTACRYCMPCPAGVDIPRNFAIWNKFSVYGNKNEAKRVWAKMENKSAKSCISCGKCEKLCPQSIAIRENLRQVTNDLGSL